GQQTCGLGAIGVPRTEVHLVQVDWRRRDEAAGEVGFGNVRVRLPVVEKDGLQQLLLGGSDRLDALVEDELQLLDHARVSGVPHGYHQCLTAEANGQDDVLVGHAGGDQLDGLHRHLEAGEIDLDAADGSGPRDGRVRQVDGDRHGGRVEEAP